MIDSEDYVGRLVDGYASERGLSLRERDVLRLAATGFLVKEIACEFKCSSRTIEEYWRRIFTKVGIRSKAAILADLLRLATIGGGHSDLQKLPPGATSASRGAADATRDAALRSKTPASGAA